MTPAPMTSVTAHLALRQTTPTEVMTLLAYAEGFELVMGTLGPATDPRQVVQRATSAVLEGTQPWEPHRRTFPAHVLVVVRAQLVDRFQALVVARSGEAISDRLRMSEAQLGNITGIFELAHSAGQLMGFIRTNDHAVFAHAVTWCDRMRRRLLAIAHGDDHARRSDDRGELS
jgi:hypothetical protein